MLNRDTWDDITPLLDEALARDSQERTAWLASMRARNPQFAAGLDSFLDEHSQLDLEGFLDDDQSPSSVSSGLADQTTDLTLSFLTLDRVEWEVFGSRIALTVCSSAKWRSSSSVCPALAHANWELRRVQATRSEFWEHMGGSHNRGNAGIAEGLLQENKCGFARISNCG